MRLRKPCEHDRYETHALSSAQWGKALSDYEWCPGGEFLPEDAVTDREELQAALLSIDLAVAAHPGLKEYWLEPSSFEVIVAAARRQLALADQGGEPG